MEEPYIGEIALFAGNFAPMGWFLCDGTVLPITQYQALFAVIGATYGGNGTSNFALPDLRGRAPICFGQGPNLSNYTWGQKGGSENTTLGTGQMPIHTHLMGASNLPADQSGPTGNVLATEPTGASAMYHALPTNTTLSATAIGTAGGSQPISNLQPYLAITYIIAWQGIFPTRP